MTINTRPTLSQAMAVLAGQCDYANQRDDVGFSASDAGVGHRLAATSPDRWSVLDHRTAHRLAVKYRRQLGAAGIDVGDLAEPPEAPASALLARVPGPCAACGGTIAAGGAFSWGSVRGSRQHADPSSCVAREPSQSDQSRSAACRLCGGLADRDDTCADCSLDLAALSTTQPRKPAKIRPSLRGRCVTCGDATPDTLSACRSCREAHEGEPAWLERAIRAKLPAPRTGLTGRQLLGNGGPVAAKLPGYAEREPQLQVVDQVEAVIRAGEHAAIEAGTGVGKSLAYMVPGLNSGHRCIVSTADKALQTQLVTKDVPFLQDVLPFGFKAALLKGRGNYVCRARVDEIQRGADEGLGGEFAFRSADAARAWPDLAAWVEETDTGDLESAPFRIPGDLAQDVVVGSDECTGKKCPFYGSCFSEQARARAQVADLIVVNHALLLRDLDVRAATGDMASILPNATVLLLDEAHHLADVARDAFAVEITPGRWLRIARRIERLTVKHTAIAKSGKDDPRRAVADTWTAMLAPISAALTRVLDDLAGRRKADSRSASFKLGDETALMMPLAVLIGSLADRMSDESPSWLDANEAESWRKMRKSAERLAEDVEAVATPGQVDEWVRYVEIETVADKARVKILAKPIDVAPMLRERMFDRFDSVVACSATIATHDEGRPSFAFWRGEVGCDEARELVVGSPFDYRRNALLYLPVNGDAFDPRKYRQEGTLEFYDRLAAEVESLLLASNGRAFVLFTSYKMLAAIHERLAPRLSYRVLRQGDASRPALVREFKADGNAVLFGTKSFWEGVDVAGDALSMVVIVGLPFAPPDDPMWSARCDAIDRKHGHMAWFQRLALPTAIIALKQGFGRLIRSVDDRGTAALLDGRLTTARYGEGIIRSLPPATRTRSIDAVRSFFGG